MILQPLAFETNPSWEGPFHLWIALSVGKLFSLGSLPFVFMLTLVIGPLRRNEYFFYVITLPILVGSSPLSGRVLFSELFPFSVFSLGLMKSISLFFWGETKCIFLLYWNIFSDVYVGKNIFSLCPCSKLKQIWGEFDIWSLSFKLVK